MAVWQQVFSSFSYASVPNSLSACFKQMDVWFVDGILAFSASCRYWIASHHTLTILSSFFCRPHIPGPSSGSQFCPVRHLHFPSQKRLRHLLVLLRSQTVTLLSLQAFIALCFHPLQYKSFTLSATLNYSTRQWLIK